MKVDAPLPIANQTLSRLATQYFPLAIASSQHTEKSGVREVGTGCCHIDQGREWNL